MRPQRGLTIALSLSLLLHALLVVAVLWYTLKREPSLKPVTEKDKTIVVGILEELETLPQSPPVLVPPPDIPRPAPAPKSHSQAPGPEPLPQQSAPAPLTPPVQAPVEPTPAPAQLIPKPPAPRPKLDPKDVVTQIAQAPQPEPANRPGSSTSAITFDTDEIAFKPYMKKLKARIETIWEYPQEALRKGLTGDLIIRFVIKKDGKLGSVEVLRTSGYPMLDQAALRALRDGQPYWPLPEGWPDEALTIEGRFVYIQQGMQVR